MMQCVCQDTGNGNVEQLVWVYTLTSPLTDVVQHTYSCALKAAKSAAAVLTDLVYTHTLDNQIQAATLSSC